MHAAIYCFHSPIPPSPYHPFISPIPHFIYLSFMCFAIAATIGSFGKPSITELHLIHPPTHTHTQLKKKLFNKVLLKPESPSSFPPVFCLKKLVISLERVPLCLEEKKRGKKSVSVVPVKVFEIIHVFQ